MGEFILQNRQRTCRIHRRHFLPAARHALEQLLQLQHYALGLHLVDDHRITHLNQSFLQHAGPTDVIAFNHLEPGDDLQLHGELFICIDEALRQARRYHTLWQDELARYFIHGVLHLLGYDDLQPASRRHMKSLENRLLRRLRRQVPLRSLGRRLPPHRRIRRRTPPC